MSELIKENIVEELIFEKINKKLNNLGRNIDDITPETDLLKSGIIDSMEFIELIAELGKILEINIEGLIDEKDTEITINWFIKKFKKIQ
tara:strand:- start:45 stop:311 length:267 start_codon:yes stop_codon:yes gene_type:complete